jgi:ribA/ribD-fused uncharacterized protein
MITERIYEKSDVVVFWKVKDEYGAFANFWRCDLVFDGMTTVSSESIYQAMKFPAGSHERHAVLSAKSAYDAKQIAKTFGQPKNWREQSIEAMRQTLRIKVKQAPLFFMLLKKSGNKPIVEKSGFDAFWGAKEVGEQLVGCNALGRLLMELRGEI